MVDAREAPFFSRVAFFFLFGLVLFVLSFWLCLLKKSSLIFSPLGPPQPHLPLSVTVFALLVFPSIYSPPSPHLHTHPVLHEPFIRPFPSFMPSADSF